MQSENCWKNFVSGTSNEYKLILKYRNKSFYATKRPNEGYFSMEINNK